MSIKKIPICPFCKGEMKKAYFTKLRGTATLILEMEEREVSGPHRDHIKSSIDLTMFRCERCGFIAFWHGEP